jgi:predicted RNA binding protein YcfA (HicA-like mRNA interferase family)
MTAIKVKDICSALKKKGFVENPKSHHVYYIFYEDGKKTAIYTFISHGKNEYGDELLSQMKKQLGFQSKTEFNDFIECPMSKEQYRDLLLERGHID